MSKGARTERGSVNDEESDADAFDSFFRAERDHLVAQAYLLVGELSAAQDLAQQALERTWRHWKKVRRYDNPAAWTRRVLFNMALNTRRRWGREQPLGKVERAVAETPEEHPEVVTALRRLPDQQRKAVVLHDAFGFSIAEVATELGAPEGTVKAWLSRGRSMLARELDGEPMESR